jgi:hypothetical protein
MEPPTNTRMNPKKAEALERRKRMTQRRQDLTQKIRKQKKSAYLAQKRQISSSLDSTTLLDNIVVGGAQSDRNNIATTRTLFQTISSTTTNDEVIFQQLNNLQIILSTRQSNNSTNKSDERPLILLDSSVDDEHIAVQFLQVLSEWIATKHLTTTTMINNNVTSSSELTKSALLSTNLKIILKVLVDLTSFTRSTRIGNDGDGDNSTSFAGQSYYGRVPTTWSELIVKMPVVASSSSSSSLSWLQLVCQIMEREVVPGGSINDGIAYMCCLIVGNVVGEGSTTIQYISSDVKVMVVRTLIAVITASLSQQQQQLPQFNVSAAAAWSLTNLIRNDVTSYGYTFVNDQILSTTILRSWLCQHPTIATQAAWMISSLTSREEDTLRYLATGLVPSLLGCLCHPIASDQQVPVLQALGNLASHSSLVPGLIQSIIKIPGNDQSPPPPPTNLVSILERMLTDLPSRDPRFIPAIWLTGCLLVDTGMPNEHPSTTMAGPALVPVIMNRLGGTSTGELKLEEDRELACALWNALEQPPDLFGEWSTDQHFMLAMPKSTLQVLVKLMKSNDDDAVLASVHVLDLYLRRVGGSSMESLQSFQDFMRTLEEEDAVHALEAVCDSHIEDAANVAADLIDDFFAELHEDDDDDDDNNNQMNADVNFSYLTENVFDNIDGGNAFGATLINPSSHVGNDVAPAAFSTDTNGMGRGRGRGATFPSWMTK